MTTDNSSINPNCALGQETAHRDIGVNGASPTAYLPALPFGRKPAPIIRNDISTVGATIAAGIAAQHAAECYANYVRAYAARARARQALGLAVRDFWASDSRLHRQWAAAEARKLGVLERGRSVVLAERWAAYQRADQAAKGCVA
ncbi:MAG TPA: hypothetical protein VGH29_07210 [Candidatus Binataceae bacterium]